MSLADPHFARFQREPIWAIGLTALLAAAGLARRPVGPYSDRNDDARLGPAHGRFAEGRSAGPAKPLGRPGTKMADTIGPARA